MFGGGRTNKPKACRRVGLSVATGIGSAERTTLVPETTNAAATMGACRLLQSRQPDFLESGFDDGVLVNTPPWKWLTSMLVANNTTNTQMTTSQDFHRSLICPNYRRLSTRLASVAKGQFRRYRKFGNRLCGNAETQHNCCICKNLHRVLGSGFGRLYEVEFAPCNPGRTGPERS
jgi:hypothetical protein